MASSLSGDSLELKVIVWCVPNLSRAPALGTRRERRVFLKASLEAPLAAQAEPFLGQ